MLPKGDQYIAVVGIVILLGLIGGMIYYLFPCFSIVMHNILKI